MVSEQLHFPDGFHWGASISAHQTEGGNNNDWTEWELQNAAALAEAANAGQDYGNGKNTLPDWPRIEPAAKDPANYISGNAVEHYRLWREDFEAARLLGLNAIRFSIEWSRIEPAPGVFDEDALRHYAEQVRYAEEIGLTPYITTHHFTNPRWFQEGGGFENRQSAGRFESFLKRAIPEIATEANSWLVINEPEVYAYQGWMIGQWPPAKRSPIGHEKVTRNLIEAHKRGYDAIKTHDSDAQVSSAVSMVDFDPAGGVAAPLNKGAAFVCRYLWNKRFLNAVQDETDFVGLNHYMHCAVDKGLFKNSGEPRSDLGWNLNPASLYTVLKQASRYKKPVVITENGLADSEDTRREWFIRESLLQVKRAVDEGVDVKGYLHWSLTDNFEWDKGFWPQFGLLKVDRDTMERTPRPSALHYGKIARNNALTIGESQ